MTLGKMTDADNVRNPQHFGSDPADIQIRIRINPEIWIRISDHFWLRFDALVEVALSDHIVVIIIIIKRLTLLLQKRRLLR